MAAEDYLTFILFDPAAKGFSIDSSTQLSATNIPVGFPAGPRAMIFKDYGAGAFPADESFVHKISWVHSTFGAARWMVPYLISRDDTLDGGVTRPYTMNEGDQVGADDSLGILTQDNNWFINSVFNGVRTFSSLGALSAGVQYWAEMIWNHVTKIFSVIVYSDSGFSIPVTSNSISHPAVTAKRYIQALSDFDNTATSWSGFQYLLDLGEEAVNVAPPHLFGRAVGL